MILIPQFYLKGGKVVTLGSASALFKDDPIATAQAIKDSGAEVVFIIDLGITALGTSPHFPILKKMHEELGLGIYVGGAFKSIHTIEGYITAGCELAVLGSVAYQQPAFLKEVCDKFPNRIGVHIDIKSGHVTIPGYTVVANKTALDYAERFLDAGVRYFFYSDVGANGLMAKEHLDKLLLFGKSVMARVICTSEVGGLSDIEKVVNMRVPRLDGIVLAKSLHEGKIDLRGAIAKVNDLMAAAGDESTMTEM